MAKQKSVLSAHGKQAAKKEKSTKKPAIDFSDIPELSDEQLSQMKRVGRPPLGETTKQLIALRVEPRLIEALRALAAKEGIGYQTLINQILEEYLDAA